MEHSDNEYLTHLVYEAALDNSLWPELMVELTEYLETVTYSLPANSTQSDHTKYIIEHLKRAFGISQKILGYQERTQLLHQVLNSISLSIVLLDNDGNAVFQNESISELNLTGSLAVTGNQLMLSNGRTKSLKYWIKRINEEHTSSSLVIELEPSKNGLLISRQEAISIGFPANVSAVLLVSRPSMYNASHQFADDKGLTSRETDLLVLLAKGNNLKASAKKLSISYESARTYLKNIFSKSEVNCQTELLSCLWHHPATMLKHEKSSSEENQKVRFNIVTNQARTLEYFHLGHTDAYPVFYFDGLSGSAFDMTGTPDKYRPHLDQLNLQIISVCRPGTFRSSYREINSLCGYASEIQEVADHLGLEKFSLFSYSYGSGTALGVAHELGDRIDRIVMSAPCYSKYIPKNWREMDLFCQLTNVVGRKWPDMLRQLLPFLVRSILQNIDRYCDRNIKRSKCQDDIAVLSSAKMRQRSAELLRDRTVNSMHGLVQENILNAQDWGFLLHGINIPTTIFHGELDNVSPLGAAKLLASELPEAQLLILQNKGHYHMFHEWRWLLALCAGMSHHDLSDIPPYYKLL